MIDRNFEPHPLAGGREVAESATARTVRRAAADEILSPESAVLPRAVVELQHHLPRGTGRVEIDVGEQDVSCADHEFRTRPGEEMLAEAGGDPLGRVLTGKDRGRSGDKLPIVTADLRSGTRGEGVLDPDKLGWWDRFGRSIGVRVGVLDRGHLPVEFRGRGLELGLQRLALRGLLGA